MTTDDLTTRVALLEQAIKDIRQELRDLRDDIRELRMSQWSQFRWLVGIMLGGYAAILLKLFAH